MLPTMLSNSCQPHCFFSSDFVLLNVCTEFVTCFQFFTVPNIPLLTTIDRKPIILSTTKLPFVTKVSKFHNILDTGVNVMSEITIPVISVKSQRCFKIKHITQMHGLQYFGSCNKNVLKLCYFTKIHTNKLIISDNDARLCAT
jgi:hypothetical protein